MQAIDTYLKSEKEQLARVDKKEKIHSPSVEPPTGEDGDKGGKDVAEANEVDEETPPEKMDLGGNEKEETDIKKVPNPPPTSTAVPIDGKSSTFCKVPILTPNPEPLLPQVSGSLPSFTLRSKPNNARLLVTMKTTRRTVTTGTYYISIQATGPGPYQVACVPRGDDYHLRDEGQQYQRPAGWRADPIV